MNKWRLISATMTIIVVIILSWLYVDRHRILFTCTGSYRSEVIFPGLHLKNNSNIMVSVANSHEIFVNVEGAVLHNNKSYHISRELRYRYTPVDLKSGLFRVTLAGRNINGSDTVASDDVNNYLFAEERSGRTIRVWKLSDSLLLVGNPYSPIYSCQRVV